MTTTRLVFPEDAEAFNKDHDASETFFELANAREIGYRKGKRLLVFEQDLDNPDHTGGIIWETSYLLLRYLIQQQVDLGDTIELGAGVGFLGCCVSAEKLCRTMVLTETEVVAQRLKDNVNRNKFKRKTRAYVLDWTACVADLAAAGLDKVDSILATDVLFSTRLVDPLLKTANKISKSTTVWYLCVQVRCKDSHELFLRRAPEYQFCVSEIDWDDPWSIELECRLYRITRKESSKSSKRKSMSQGECEAKSKPSFKQSRRKGADIP